MDVSDKSKTGFVVVVGRHKARARMRFGFQSFRRTTMSTKIPSRDKKPAMIAATETGILKPRARIAWRLLRC